MKDKSILCLPQKYCCGCSSCFSICPVGAIQMTYINGFLYPVVNKQICTNCGLCSEACQISIKHKNTKQNILEIACQNRSIEERKTSRSGGVFVELARVILKENGVVYGCAKNNEFLANQIAINSINEINKLKGSKYIQSNLGGTFKDAAKDLVEGKTVLFSGTGCQLFGLKTYLSLRHISMDNLITCDIICHGVPSPLVWKEYLEVVEENNNSKIKEVIFRDKEKYGWSGHVETFILENGLQVSSKENRFYQKSFFRESCYNCSFTTPYRDTDFTIGDCWGIQNIDNPFNEQDGVSMVLIRTNKGLSLFDKIKNNLIYLTINVNNYLQPQLKAPTKKPRGYKSFYKHFNKNKKKAVKKQYFQKTAKEKMLLTVSKIKRMIYGKK